MEESESRESSYKDAAEQLKDQGNEAFKKGDTQLAIQLYSQAIEIDPDNYIYYSNRSAAYMTADSISKALRDAEKCVEVAPQWAKGYHRLGAAQQGLKRFEAAEESLKKGITIDANNEALWSALNACKEAAEADKKMRFQKAEWERQQEEERQKKLDAMKAEALAAKMEENKREDEDDLLSGFFSEIQSSSSSSSSSVKTAAGEGGLGAASAPTPASAPEDDLLSGFFNEISATTASSSSSSRANNSATSPSQQQPEQPPPPPPRDEKILTVKYTNQDLGKGEDQVERLTGRHYEWKNLNPFYVLQLDVDATEEDIKYRYRKLSAKIHPDKLLTNEKAREAFEQVKNAYQKLLDESQKKILIMNIENTRQEVTKERRRLLAKGSKECDLPPLDEDTNKQVMKMFADMELERRRAEKYQRAHSAREKMNEAEEYEKLKKGAEFEKEWGGDERREKRIGNWRDFQKSGGDNEAKRAKIASSFREETKVSEKFGEVKTDEWKKKWK